MAIALEQLDDAAVLAELELAADREDVPDEVLAEAEECRASFAFFAQAAWPIIEPGVPLSWGRLQGAVAEHLEAVTRGQIHSLLINVRPRSSKSRLVSVLWEAWEWALDPTIRWLTGSHELNVSRDLSRLCLDLMKSSWYQQRFGSRTRVRRDLNAPSHFGLVGGGERIITANRAGVTGMGGERLVWDDPHDAKKAGSKADLESARVFWRAFSSRVNNRDARRVVVGQRVAHADIFSTLMAQGGWEVLRLSTRYKPHRHCRTSIGWSDPRTQERELLDPERHGEVEDAKAQIELGPQDYAAQHDQDPTPEGGTTFKLEDFRRWRFVTAGFGVVLPEFDERGRKVALVPEPGPAGEGWGRFFDDLCWSWDFAFRGEADSDFVVGQLWGRKGPDFYLLYQLRARMDFPACLMAMTHTANLYPVAYTKLVEAAANGPGIVAMLRSKLLGMIEVTTKGKDKPARARAVAPLVRAGNVYVPEDSHPAWGPESSVALYLEELRQFPKGANDDQVDATSQALAHLYELYQAWLEAIVTATGQMPGSEQPGEAADPEKALQALLNPSS